MPLTHAQLEATGDLVATAIKTVIAADTPTFPLPAYAHRHLGAMNVNRVEVTATNFDRASDQMGLTSNLVPFYSHRRGSISLSVVTARTDQTSSDNHAYAVGRLRYLLSRPGQKLTSNVLSGLYCLDLVDHGESVSVDEKTDLDRTTLNFAIDLFVPVSVYEAAT